MSEPTWKSSGHGLCLACHGEIRPGDWLTYDGALVVHLDCPDPEEARDDTGRMKPRRSR